ncbi:hypothetical protein [Thioclava sp. GXIMD4216]|uniref:TadE/TadG family type IV pilus assembly protein n=1 Tax=Thioclava sp. GXIMD4216 TaxID=3131929 RepID=UPI0030D21461
MTPLRLSLHKMHRDEDGSIPIEAIFAYLILTVWIFLAFQFYDAFRKKGEVSRAAYAVADILSRERSAIGPSYLAGMKKVYDFAARKSFDGQTMMRVTLIECHTTAQDTDNCDGVTKKATLIGSYPVPATGGLKAQTQASLDNEADRIPIMGAGDTAVIVETLYRYRPPFNIGNLTLLLPGGNGSSDAVKVGMAQTKDGIPIGNFVVTRRRGTPIQWDPSS